MFILVDLTVAQIIRLMESSQLQLRQEPFDPGAPLSDANFPLYDRGTAIATAISNFDGLNLPPATTRATAILATLGARGCGKSRIVDEICRLCGGNKLPNNLKQRLVPVAISFNGRQSYGDENHLKPVQKLCCRMAHSGFFDTNKVKFGVFMRWAQKNVPWNRVSPQALFDAMIKNFKLRMGVKNPAILLAVDEVVKLTRPSGSGDELKAILPVAEVLDCLKKTILDNNTTQCRLLITTFDYRPLLDHTVSTILQHLEEQRNNKQKPKGASKNTSVSGLDSTGSKRNIMWLELNPIQQDGPYQNLLVYRDQYGLQGDVTDAQVAYYVSLCGGHPRSLAMLVDEFRKQQHNPRVSQRFVEDWARAMQGYMVAVHEELLLDLLAMSVCGHEVTLTTKFRGYSLVDLVQKTVIINGIVPDEKFNIIPQLSLLRLQVWGSKPSEQHESLRRCVKSLLDSGFNMGAENFERFQALFEELHKWAFHRLETKTTSTNLKEWFRSPYGLLRGPNSRFTVPTPELQTHVGQLPGRVGTLTGTLRPGSYVGGKNQPGFDVVTVMHRRALVLENKWSRVNEGRTATRLDRLTVWDKVSKATTELQGSLLNVGNKPIEKACAGFVLLAHRDPALGTGIEQSTVSSPLQQFVQVCSTAPERGHTHFEAWKAYKKTTAAVLILDRAAIIKYFGPTFSRLGGFLFSFADHHYRQVASVQVAAAPQVLLAISPTTKHPQRDVSVNSNGSYLHAENVSSVTEESPCDETSVGNNNNNGMPHLFLSFMQC